MQGADVLAAADAATRFLRPLTGRDWSRELTGLDFTVASVIAHAAEGPLWYAVDFAGGPAAAAFELRMDPDASPSRLLASLTAAARLCAITVDGLPPDASTGLGESFDPGPGLPGRILARLFPWQAPEPDAWAALLHANGRIDLSGQPRRQNWRWLSVPLGDWDGRIPT
jgi:Mycothiol maleylpyruvate isomerase N-terminal domain